MKLNAKLLSFILLATTALFVYLMVGQCTTKQEWQDIAKHAFKRIGELKTDSAHWHRESDSRDKIIAKQNKQFDEATAIAYGLKAERNRAVVKSDQAVAKLTAQQRLAAFYKALSENGTLNPVYLPNAGLFPQPDTQLIAAGLKTAERAKIDSLKLEELQLSVSVRDARITALRNQRDRATKSSIKAEAILTKESRTKRFLGKGRKAAMSQGADEVRQIRESEPSALELELNQ